MRFLPFSFLVAATLFASSLHAQSLQQPEALVAVIDTIWRTEQEPIRLRDELMRQFGVEHPKVQEQQEIYERNHAINERKVGSILARYGWPSRDMIGGKRKPGHL